jgi:hypothetical protein
MLQAAFTQMDPTQIALLSEQEMKETQGARGPAGAIGGSLLSGGYPGL